MKVVYRSIAKELDEAIRTADENHRTIQYFELTPNEYAELSRERPNCGYGMQGDLVRYSGVEIRRSFKVGA